MKVKFQPRPRAARPSENWMRSTPISAATMHPASNAVPMSMMVATPNFRIRLPVKNAGANMAIVCH